MISLVPLAMIGHRLFGELDKLLYQAASCIFSVQQPLPSRTPVPEITKLLPSPEL